MKKLNLKGKLALNKQVVSVLQPTELQNIQGGATAVCTGTCVTNSCQICTGSTCVGVCTMNCPSAAC